MLQAAPLVKNTARRPFPLRYWKGTLKVLFVAGLLYFLAKKGFLSFEATKRAFTDLGTLIPAIVALLLTTGLAVTRWQWLLQAQNIDISWMQALKLTLVGNFFNIALPGAVSGDFVKAFFLAKEIQGRRGRAFGAILFDRVAGLCALVLVSASALALDFGALKGTPLLRGIQVMVATAAVGAIVFLGYLFLVPERRDPVLWLFRSAERKHPKAGSLTRIYEGLRHYHDHRWTVIKVLAISIMIHVIVCTCCIFFARALGETSLPWLPVYVVVPLGLLVTAVPILPAGVGTGHAALGWLFQFLGSQRGADVFSLFALSQFIGGGIGGLVYLRYRSHAPKLSEVVEVAENLAATEADPAT